MFMSGQHTAYCIVTIRMTIVIIYQNDNWLVVWNISYFAYIGNSNPSWHQLTYIFQRGWNHQPDNNHTHCLQQWWLRFDPGVVNEICKWIVPWHPIDTHGDTLRVELTIHSPWTSDIHRHPLAQLIGITNWVSQAHDTVAITHRHGSCGTCMHLLWQAETMSVFDRLYHVARVWRLSHPELGGTWWNHRWVMPL